MYQAEPLSAEPSGSLVASESSNGELDAKEVSVLGSSVPTRDRLQAGMMEGTPLFTITEQNSLATLKNLPTTTTTQRRVATLHVPSATKLQQAQNSKLRAKAHRQCLSLDENTLQSMHTPKLHSSSHATTSAG